VKKNRTRDVAFGAWVMFSVGEFVIFPRLFGLGMGVAGLPEEAKQSAYPGLWIWWMAVKIGLPVWLLASAACAWVFFKGRD